MANIPKSIKWLLGFANLGCKPGELKPQRLKGDLLIVKRPPIEPPLDFNAKFPDFENFHYSFRKKDAWTKCSCGRRYGLIDYPCGKGYKDNKPPCVGYDEWLDCSWERDKRTKILKYLGEGEVNPTFQEFMDFFLKPEKEKILKFNTESAKCPVGVFHESCRGILPAPPIPAMLCRDNIHKYFIILWAGIRSILSFVIRNDEDYISIQETFEIVKSDARLQNHPIPKTIYNALFDFLLISSGGLLQVKQCSCCGRFHTEKSKFCSDECKIRQHLPSRKSNRKSVTNTRKYNKQRQQKEDYKKICDIYSENGYSQEDAEQPAYKWVYVDKKTYKQFLRKERSFRGEGLL